VIVSFVVDVTGPAGTRRYRVTDTDLNEETAGEIAAQRYCVDTPSGLTRRSEVRAVVGPGEVVESHTPRPAMPIGIDVTGGAV
jgi:hypothetical protein